MFATLRIALMAIRRNVLRSFLTMLGIIVGIAAVIVGVSMGTGAKAEVDKRIAGMGQNLITVMSGNMTRGGVRGGFGMAPNLSIEDFEAMRREVSQVTAVSPEAGPRPRWLRATRTASCRCRASRMNTSPPVRGP